MEVSILSTMLKSRIRCGVDRSFSSLMRVRMPDPFWLFAEEWLFIAEGWGHGAHTRMLPRALCRDSKGSGIEGISWVRTRLPLRSASFHHCEKQMPGLCLDLSISTPREYEQQARPSGFPEDMCVEMSGSWMQKKARRR